MIKSLDVILAILVLSIISIIILPLVLIKLIIDGFPFFYCSNRVGLSGKTIRIYKFRTMINSKSAIDNYINSLNNHGFQKIPLGAPIYTSLGRFFERFQIVELPQLINILFGQMSFIGYRPLPEKLVLELKEEMGNKIIDLRH